MIYSLLRSASSFENYWWGAALHHLHLLFCRSVYSFIVATLRRFCLGIDSIQWARDIFNNAKNPVLYTTSFQLAVLIFKVARGKGIRCQSTFHTWFGNIFCIHCAFSLFTENLKGSEFDAKNIIYRGYIITRLFTWKVRFSGESIGSTYWPYAIGCLRKAT